jgi:cyanophycin synthetase
MEILRVRALAGANVWSRASVLEAVVALASEARWSGDDVLLCERRLSAYLPEWSRSRAVTVDSSPARMADVLQRVTLALQVEASSPGARGFVGALSPANVVDIAIECQEERLGRACLAAAHRLCQAALRDESFDLPAERARLRALAEDVCLGRATGPLVAAAQARGIPYRRLDGESLVQLGHGARRRRIRTSLTERTGKLAEWLSLDKELTKRLLAEVGIAVPVGRRVGSADEAWAAACELGMPVAVKPASADYGHGIGLHLTTREQVAAAYAAAREYRDEVLVERFVPGEQYRVTVVGGRVVAAVRREPVRLTGDGEHTVTELMALANRDPRRGDDLRLPLTPVCPDDDTPQVLAEQGFRLESVVPKGRELVLSRIAHSWAGAGVTDVTDAVHPDVAAQCVRAVRLLGLDVAGLDLVALDIARPLGEQGGAILEVNAEPTIAFHFPPLGETYRPVCEAILDSLFPDGETSRIPLAVVSGAGPRARSGRLLTRLLLAAGRKTGRASADGLSLGDELVKPGRQDSLAGTLATLLCPEVEIAVLERELTSLREEGLGVDRVAVVLLTGLAGSATAGLDAEAARAAAVLCEVAAPNGTVVMDGDDRAARALVESFPGTVVLVGGDGAVSTPGRAAVFLRDGAIVFRSLDGREQAVALGEGSSLFRGADPGWLLAVAAAWAMGVSAETVGGCLPALMREV